MLRTDRGQEFKSAIFEEYCSLMGMRHHVSAAMRPCEMGPNERVHQECQKILGFMLNDVARGQANEWSEYLPVVEFVIAVTPGAHGWCPRDLSRKRSAASPLERELLSLEVGSFENMTQYTRDLFKSYREVKADVMEHLRKSSAVRAELANRHRKQTTYQVGTM